MPTQQSPGSNHISVGTQSKIQPRTMKQALLNGFEFSFSADTFFCAIRDWSGPGCVKTAREEFGSKGFVYSRNGKIYILPKDTKDWTFADELVELNCTDHLQLLAASITEVLPERFPDFDVLSRRPMQIASRKTEIVQDICKRLNSVTALTKEFKIRPKYRLETRVIEPSPADLKVALFVRFESRLEIHAELEDLIRAGVELSGLYVKLRQKQAGRSLVGRVKTVKNGVVELSESYIENSRQMPASDVMLEGSKQSFCRCLTHLLGKASYKLFEQAREEEEAGRLSGSPVAAMLTKIQNYLSRDGELRLFGGLTAKIERPVQISNTPAYQSVTNSNAIEYCFDAARVKRSEYAWPGLQQFGPFSRDTFARKSPLIWVIFPDTIQGLAENFLKKFREGIMDKFPGGFGKLFCLTNPQFKLIPVSWLENRLAEPATLYKKAIEDQIARSVLPDAALVFLLDSHAQLPDIQNPYIQSKAALLMAGIPSQEIRDKTASKPDTSLQYVLQNVAIALYAKMNGVPWTVDHDTTISDELIVGLGACELSGSRFEERQRFVGITTVFRGDGNYLLGNLSKECSYSEYADVLRDSISSILKEIKTRNGWQNGDTVRLVFHSFKPFKNIEIAEIVHEAVREIGNEQNVEFAFLDVSFDHPFMILDKEQPGVTARSGAKKAVFVPNRGSIVEIGKFTRLVCLNGTTLVKRDLSPLPAPLLVHLHKQSTFKDLQYLSEQVLKFTSLSWKSNLPAAKPVTIYYSEMIAELLARFRNLRDWSPAMLNSKLRTSRWYL